MSKLDLKGQEKRLREAAKYLKIVSALTYGSASETKPFEASKFLNVMGKITAQMEHEIKVLIGEMTYSDFEMRIQAADVMWPTPTLPILKRMVELGLVKR